ncbi:MAG: hypothetical protein FIA91_05140 [Geobacter sp.]|nr:hypothetical protein [Geobacter sp.]
MSGIAPELLTRILGIPLFTTPYFLPVYPSGDQGSWRLSQLATGFDHGYYTSQWLVSGMPLLLRRNPGNPELWETWMSLTPHEIESQEPGCHCAHGHTAIMGLGMGWVAMNAALNPAVRKVTVIELDQEVIELIGSSNIIGQLPPEIAAKITVVKANAMEWQPAEPVDFLYADIWRPVADTNALGDTRCMQKNVQAKRVYFWGQELRLYTAFRERFGEETPLTLAGLKQCVNEDLQLPLLLPWGDDYPAMIEMAVKNRITRGLPLEEAA